MTLPSPAPIYYSKRTGRYIAELWRRREFAWYLALGDLKSRNASTVFGIAWWMLNPLLLAGVYFLVFGLLFDRGEGYLGYLVAGMFPFHFTSLAMSGGANSILSNSRLLANLRFPRVILPTASLIESGVGFMVSLGMLYVIVGPFEGRWPGLHTLLLLAIIPLHFLFNLGLGCFAARLAVPFRDVTNLIPYLSRMWLYMSPVIWPLDLLDRMEPWLQRVVEFNPMFSFLGVYRSALLGYPFDPSQLAAAGVWAAVLVVFGVGAFVKYEGNIVRYL